MHYDLMKTSNNFSKMLKESGYSTEVIEKMWKWSDYSEKKGAASYQFILFLRFQHIGSSHFNLVNKQKNWGV